MSDNMGTANAAACDRNNGVLPSCTPLASPFVPFQQTGSDRYESEHALVRGTLFPGLDLPFKNMMRSSPMDDTPLNELMALEFAMHELGLYLDTHMDDREALELFATYAKMAQEGREQYEKMSGHLLQRHVTVEGGYSWVSGPWPWEPANRKEG